MINTKIFCLLFLSILVSLQTLAQSSPAKNKSPFPVKYTSLVDQKIILKTITLAPVYDNVDGVYANPIQKLLVDLLQSDKVWGYSEFPDFSKKIFIEKFDTLPNDVLDVLAKTKSQGLLTAFITKGPKGLNAKLKLFTQDQGWILLEESFQDINTFEISKLRQSFVEMYHNIKNKLPYRGYVLSRRGLDVTLNLGSVNGVKLGQELTLAQILKLNRHPKLKTMVGVEKEIIAKVKVTQVEPYLSFAQITFEKETGVVDVGAKVLPTDYISYPVPQLNSDGAVVGDNSANTPVPPVVNNEPPPAAVEEKPAPEKPIDSSLQEQKSELLDRQNSMGVFTAQGVITQYSESSQLLSGANPQASQGFAPGAFLGLQLFFLENFFFDVNAQINMFNANNSLTGSNPYTLSYTYMRYSGLVGYDFYLSADPDQEDNDNIKLSVGLGINSYKTTVSNTTPTALTSTQTNDIAFQFKAQMPLSEQSPITIGGKFDLSLAPQFSESPVSSGDPKASVTSFGLFGIYNISDKIRFRADLNITNISTHFSGGTVTRADRSTTTSIQMVSEQAGVEYLF